MSDVLIIGCGVVGNNLLKELSVLTPDVVDKYKKEKTTKKKEKYKFGFVCVDTPYDKEKELFDTSEVVNAMNENDCEIYVVKSTVPIGFVDSLGKENIVFSPEYYGGTQHCNNFKFDFTILGGCEKTCDKVIQLLQKVYDGRHRFLKMKSSEAEMVKLMENCFLATKVSFCNSFYEMCKKYNCSYESVREGFILDERCGSSHTFVYEEKPYWDSHCLNKDTVCAAIQGNDFMNGIIRYNNEKKKINF